jgi:monoamine oxidase
VSENSSAGRHSILTNDDFAQALYHPIGRVLRAAASTDSEIPDEEEPLDAVFTQIIKSGLPSLNGPCRPARVIIAGAGPAGLCAAWELKRAGFDVVILEASHRVGGRVKTIFEPFTPGLHAEGGAMRLPQNHLLVHTYLNRFGRNAHLEPFDQANKLIYLSTYGSPLTYDEFDLLLHKQDQKLLSCFPGLLPAERGKTIDELWAVAIQPVVDAFNSVYQGNPANVAAAYAHIVQLYDQYSLQTFFEQVAGWSQDCISLYDLGSPHVVLDNAFIESWKDAFLSSQAGGEEAKMEQMMYGMQEIPSMFLDPADAGNVKDDIRYGARVTYVEWIPDGGPGATVSVAYTTRGGATRTVTGDYVLFALPFTSQRRLRTNVPFSVTKTNAIRTLRYVEVTKILLQFKTRWWEPFLTRLGQGTDGGLVTDLPVRYTMFPVSTSVQLQNEKRGVIMASYTFQQDATQTGAMTRDGAVELAVGDLATIFGREIVYDNIEVGTSQVWSADIESGGSAFAYFAPMQKTRLFATMIGPEWNNAAHFAGEQVSYSHGWIEGAFESALRAAYQIYVNQLQGPR